MTYYFSKTVTLSFDDAIEKVIAELKKEGFVGLGVRHT
jgi:uncharacterized protein (DUF302 family)